MKKFMTTTLYFIFISFCLWISMLCIDFSFSEHGRPPLFAKSIPATDCDMYKGFGYTIVLGYESAVGQPGESVQGRFYLSIPFMP